MKKSRELLMPNSSAIRLPNPTLCGIAPSAVRAFYQTYFGWIEAYTGSPRVGTVFIEGRGDSEIFAASRTLTDL